jgi:hypothetical protein
MQAALLDMPGQVVMKATTPLQIPLSEARSAQVRQSIDAKKHRQFTPVEIHPPRISYRLEAFGDEVK